MSSLAERRQLPPYLLAPYVAAAAREVVEQRPLHEWSESALSDAVQQLELECVALEGDGACDSERALAALAATNENTFRFAELALAVTSQPTPESLAAERNEGQQVVERLRNLIEELRAVAAGDSGAAKRLLGPFERMTDLVSAGPGAFDLV